MTMTNPRPLHDHINDALDTMTRDGATPDEIEATAQMLDHGMARVLIETGEHGSTCVVDLPWDTARTRYWELLEVPASEVSDLPSWDLIQTHDRLASGAEHIPDDPSSLEP